MFLLCYVTSFNSSLSLLKQKKNIRSNAITMEMKQGISVRFLQNLKYEACIYTTA